MATDLVREHWPNLAELVDTLDALDGRQVTSEVDASHGHGGGIVINVYVTVEGHVRSDRELAEVIRSEFIRAIRRSPAAAYIPDIAG